MVDIEEVKDVTLEQVIQQIMERLARLEATVGYIIHSIDLKPPRMTNDAETGVDSEESSE